jgi:hypothetical protein
MYDQAKGALRELQKAGKAELVVELTAAPDDPHFSNDPPSCAVTVIAKDPNDPKKVPEQTTKEISRQTDRPDRTFHISAETTVGVIGRLIFREKPKSLELTITVTPINGWEEHYESTQKTVKVAAGESRAIAVSLRPKDSRASRPIHLDKPKLSK